MQQHVRRTGHKQVARRTGWRSRSDPAIGGRQRERAISAFSSKQSSSSKQSIKYRRCCRCEYEGEEETLTTAEAQQSVREATGRSEANGARLTPHSSTKHHQTPPHSNKQSESSAFAPRPPPSLPLSHTPSFLPDRLLSSTSLFSGPIPFLTSPW